CYRGLLLVTLIGGAADGCVGYVAPSQRAVADSVAPVHRGGVRFTTADGRSHELFSVRVARDTLFGVQAGAVKTVLGFALPDIQHCEVPLPTQPHPGVRDLGTALSITPLMMMYAIWYAFLQRETGHGTKAEVPGLQVRLEPGRPRRVLV